MLGILVSGLVVPRLSDGDASAYGYNDSWVMYYEFEVVNDGITAVEIVDVGRSGPGLDLVDHPIGVDGSPSGVAQLPVRVAAGDHVWLGVAYEVTDCDAVPSEPWPVPVTVSRPWGTHTTWLSLPEQSRLDYHLPTAGAGDEGEYRDEAVEWQRALAEAVCHYREGGEPWTGD